MTLISGFLAGNRRLAALVRMSSFIIAVRGNHECVYVQLVLYWCQLSTNCNHYKQIPTRWLIHYDDIIMSAIASQITSLAIVYSTVYSDVDQRKHQSSASLAFVWGIHRGPVNSPHKWPVTRKMFPFDDVIMYPCRVRVWSNTLIIKEVTTSNGQCATPMWRLHSSPRWTC